MDARTRARVAVAVVAALGAVALAGLGLAMVYGFSVEYGGGSFADLAFLVVPIPVLSGVVAVVVWPGLPARVRWTTVAAFSCVLVAAGFAADSLGRAAHRDRLTEESRTFTCNGPHAEVTVPDAVDDTWQELPRPATIYGPLGGTARSCRAGVSGDPERAFADYTAAFRDLDEWQVRKDEETRFVMTRDDVRVRVRLSGVEEPTTIEVALTG